jgi:hypothetical protein
MPIRATLDTSAAAARLASQLSQPPATIKESPMPNDNSHITKADLESALHALEQRLEKRFGQLQEYIDERTHDAETRLLRAFGDYSRRKPPVSAT